jgi:hypothetical protein
MVISSSFTRALPENGVGVGVGAGTVAVGGTGVGVAAGAQALRMIVNKRTTDRFFMAALLVVEKL